MLKIVTFVITFLVLIQVQARAEEIITDINIAGEVFKDVVVDTETFKLSEPIKVGKCQSDNLLDFGNPRLESGKVVIETLNQECFDSKEISLSYKNTFTPLKSNSVFLSFNLNKALTKEVGDSIYLGSGLYIQDFYLYSAFSLMKSQGEYRWERLYTYLQRDIDPLLSVIRLGEVFANTSSSLVSTSERQFSLQFQRKWIIDPNQRPYMSLSKQIILNTKSTVEIIQNNSVVLRTELPPGVYNLRDLPISSLIGTYTIRITDAFGRVTEQTETYVASAEMLKKGVLDYSVTLLLENPELAGFLRYGIFDNFIAGIHFSKKEQSVSLDYLHNFGQTSLEISTKSNMRLAHTYQKDSFNASAEFLRKDSENSYTLTVSYTTEKYGSFSLRVEKTNEEKAKAGVNWSKSFSNVNVSLNANTNSEVNINTSYSTKLFNRNVSLGASYTHSKNDKRFYAYLTMPLENKDKTWGTDIRTSHSKQTETTTVETELKARYLFDYAVLNKFDKERNTTSVAITGAFGCVQQNSKIKCGFGNFVSEGDGFVIASGETTIEGKERKGLNTLTTYRDVTVRNTTEFVETDLKIAARSGQGVLIPEPILVLGKVLNVKAKSIFINNDEVFITEDGDFTYVSYSDEIEIRATDGRSQKIKLKAEQGVANVEIVF